jgi:hypothetical protein
MPRHYGALWRHSACARPGGAGAWGAVGGRAEAAACTGSRARPAESGDIPDEWMAWRAGTFRHPLRAACAFQRSAVPAGGGGERRGRRAAVERRRSRARRRHCARREMTSEYAPLTTGSCTRRRLCECEGGAVLSQTVAPPLREPACAAAAAGARRRSAAGASLSLASTTTLRRHAHKTVPSESAVASRRCCIAACLCSPRSCRWGDWRFFRYQAPNP